MAQQKSKKSTKEQIQQKMQTPLASMSSAQLSRISTADVSPNAMNQGDLSHKLRIEMMKRKLKRR